MSVELRPPRSLLAMALDNAVEGCVRETYGALCAHYQASTANDTDVRSAWQRIAEEETAHALLSRDLDAWLLPQLSHAEREQVEAARRDAIDELYREVQAEPDTAVRELAGMPSAAHATQLINGLSARSGPARRSVSARLENRDRQSNAPFLERLAHHETRPRHRKG